MLQNAIGVTMSNLRQRKEHLEEQDDEKSEIKVVITQTNWKQPLLKGAGLVFATFSLGVLLIEVCIPCPIQPEEIIFDPIPKFEGPLEANNELKRATKIGEGAYKGAESLGYYKGKIYTGVSDGRIIEIDIKTNEIRTVVEMLGQPPCGGFANEKNCGRPLGIRVKDGFIFAVDSYLGLFKINLATGKKEMLFNASRPLLDGLPAKFLNDIELGDDGMIYLTDTSYEYHRENYPYVMWEGSGKGRLLKFDPVTKEVEILLRDLYGANGLQFTSDQSSLLIAESTLCRVVRYYLKGPRKGENEIFSNNLPGVPDNIRSSSGGGYWVALANVRHPDRVSLWDIAFRYPALRRFIIKTVNKYSIWQSLVQPYGLVLELDKEGNIIRSLHDQDGSVFPSSSEILDRDGHLYFGSFYLPYLNKYKLS